MCMLEALVLIDLIAYIQRLLGLLETDLILMSRFFSSVVKLFSNV